MAGWKSIRTPPRLGMIEQTTIHPPHDWYPKHQWHDGASIPRSSTSDDTSAFGEEVPFHSLLGLSGGREASPRTRSGPRCRPASPNPREASATSVDPPETSSPSGPTGPDRQSLETGEGWCTVGCWDPHCCLRGYSRVAV